MYESDEPASADGLLLPDELDQIVASYVMLSPLTQIDSQASDLLERRNAVGQFEIKARERGDNCLTVLHHRIVRRIVLGETYDVLLAQQLFLGRLDTIKLLLPDRATQEIVAVHLRRMRKQSTIACQQLVQVYDTGFERGVHFSVIENVPGADLGRIVPTKGSLAMAACASIGTQVAKGLDAIHESGLVHGSLRPTKVLVAPCGAAKLADVGTAQPSGAFDLSTRGLGLRADYLAPEVLLSGQVSPLSDVYLLGCVLYFAITGTPPFPGGTKEQKAQSHCTLYPLDPARVRDDLDEGFIRVIGDMMAKKPADRIQSMPEVAERLLPWMPTG